MRNTEIYENAIIKATDNSKDLFVPRLIVDRYELFDYEIYYVIFSHEFAKAFWGKEMIFTGKFEFDQWEMSDGALNDGEYSKIEDYCWRHHLTQMVQEEEPLKYLEKFL